MKKELYTLPPIEFTQSEREMIAHSNYRIVNSSSKILRVSSVILVVSILASLMLIRSGQSADIPTFEVVPTYTAAKIGDVFSVQIQIFGADYADLTDVHTWQVRMYWTPAVLDLASVTFGTFMDGPRIGYWGDLVFDAPVGQKNVTVTDGSKFAVGNPVLIRDDLHSETTNSIASILGNKLIMVNNLAYTYTVAAHGGAYPDPATTTSTTTLQYLGYSTFGVVTQGTIPGAQGDGLLATVNFNVEQNLDTALSIDNGFTYLINLIGEVKGDNPGELIRINGYKAWAEDISANGVIGVNDLYWVGKDYQKCPIQTRHPTATSVVVAGWTNPANAYTSNNSRTTTTVLNAAQAYTSYGFATTGWTGIAKVEIGLERMINPGGDDQIRIAVSNNGGTNWSANVTVTPTTTDTFSWYDFTAAFAWNVAGVQNIAVRIASVRVGGATTLTHVDWIPVRVTPTPTSTNAYSDITKDGIDNSADLTQLAAKYGQTYGP